MQARIYDGSALTKVRDEPDVALIDLLVRVGTDAETARSRTQEAKSASDTGDHRFVE
jgi:hypothetical protein